MADINTVVVSGRIVRDPELRHTNSGTAVLNNAIAVEEYVKDGDNGVSFYDFTVWGNYAELLSRKLRKGDSVTLAGRLTQRKWEDKETGENRSKVELVARDLVGDFQYRKNGENAASGAEPEAEPVLAGAQPFEDDIPF